MHHLFPLLEGSQLAQHASMNEAHRAVDTSSCGSCGCLWSDLGWVAIRRMQPVPAWPLSVPILLV